MSFLISLLQTCKPDSVFRLETEGYHLSCCYITATILLPTLQLRRAALKRWYTWHYSTQGLPKNIVTNTSRELLPHVFTLIPIINYRDGNFLRHFLFAEIVFTIQTTRPLTGVLLYAVRTFLSDFNRNDNPVCSKAKIVNSDWWIEG